MEIEPNKSRSLSVGETLWTLERWYDASLRDKAPFAALTQKTIEGY